MDIFETISKRFSYRGAFTDQPVPREDLIKIVQAGIDAPSGCNAQSTNFVIVDEVALIASVAKVLGDRPVCKTAKGLIVCVCDKMPAYGNLSFFIEDCSAATQNMLLAITALGYASVWLDGVIRGSTGVEIGKLLNVPTNQEVRILLPVGVPQNQSKPNPKKAFQERARFAK
ncbi:MAG: nitroreductase family protein [Planctomycetaceae bacterium]|jgi:nitroreductase|nr:nitroreductase family protein [Planctomycetaceae bacterium]